MPSNKDLFLDRLKTYLDNEETEQGIVKAILIVSVSSHDTIEVGRIGLDDLGQRGWDEIHRVIKKTAKKMQQHEEDADAVERDPTDRE